MQSCIALRCMLESLRELITTTTTRTTTRMAFWDPPSGSRKTALTGGITEGRTLTNMQQATDYTNCGIVIVNHQLMEEKEEDKEESWIAESQLLRTDEAGHFTGRSRSCQPINYDKATNERQWVRSSSAK